MRACLVYSSLSSSLLVFLKDPTCSRILDKVLEVSDAKALRSFYKVHVKGQLRALSAHKVANFTLQRLIHAASRKLVRECFCGWPPSWLKSGRGDFLGGAIGFRLISKS